MRHIRPTCSRCIYWAESAATGTGSIGHCHRYPPVVIANPETGTVVQKFPTTAPRHWCGEWSGDDSRLASGIASTVAGKSGSAKATASPSSS